MKLKPRIVRLKAKKLVGQQLTMSLINNLTGVLWTNFRFKTAKVQNRIGVDFISMQIYSKDYFETFIPQREFQKWATVEVSSFDNLPEGMEAFTLNEGAYAVFDYKGSSADPTVFQYIYNEWLPNSEYELDDRPHFEVLGKKYKNNDPTSEGKIWIPIKKA